MACVSSGDGGAVFAMNNSSPTFTDCVFEDNVAAAKGGGIYIGDSPTEISGCRVVGNSSGSNGGGVYAKSDPLLLVGTVVAGNLSDNKGGGVYFRGADVTLRKCSLAANAAREGGGLFLENAPAMVGTTIVWGNCAIDAGAEIYLLGEDAGFDCSDVGMSGVEEDGGASANFGNTMDLDPLFCLVPSCDSLPASVVELGLTTGSPCLPGGIRARP